MLRHLIDINVSIIANLSPHILNMLDLSPKVFLTKFFSWLIIFLRFSVEPFVKKMFKNNRSNQSAFLFGTLNIPI